ncbi:type II toxin-antitoxin system death-on-curing family toxin [Prosthecodimorpha staleyi]|uniref:Type II toxin-antitoxin system death-on-curing family toxin n=1 Tax=Prosthecodimorpha staleyi TaxID=2840188 RepID=A0A947GA92_9HYPH|nr:type II toxin-antitoxin system death-on-curing family toxin [Prosthecodimorpha staleyi]MBT9288858.1 type II toxin-antitoxin system death-on-curing family toxin [Prosthecodimorpha staleyi]
MTGPVETGFGQWTQAGFGPRWVEKAEVLALHEKQIDRFGGAAGIRDEGALESALGRPRNKWEYERGGLAVLAAAYAFGIARNRPFVEGSTRAAFVTLMLFLRENAMIFRPPQIEAARIMLDLAAGSVSEEGLARWIENRSDGAGNP